MSEDSKKGDAASLQRTALNPLLLLKPYLASNYFQVVWAMSFQAVETLKGLKTIYL